MTTLHDLIRTNRPRLQHGGSYSFSIWATEQLGRTVTAQEVAAAWREVVAERKVEVRA